MRMIAKILSRPLYSGENAKMFPEPISRIYEIVMFKIENSTSPKAISLATIMAAYFIFLEVDF